MQHRKWFLGSVFHSVTPSLGFSAPREVEERALHAKDFDFETYSPSFSPVSPLLPISVTLGSRLTSLSLRFLIYKG